MDNLREKCRNLDAKRTGMSEHVEKKVFFVQVAVECHLRTIVCAAAAWSGMGPGGKARIYS